MLQQTFTDLAQRYTRDNDLITRLWTEIEHAYTHKNRHYHTLTHLEQVLAELQPFQHRIADWDVVLFSLFYHDLVYDTLRHDNEEQSAAVAQQRLTALGLPAERVERCQNLILATKKHEAAGDFDTDLFTDADLSILGQPWERYAVYLQQIRQEYSLYPDLLFRPGRRKVVRRFLQMPRIFKISELAAKYEKQARSNLKME